ncbi:MAG: lamin tail domain-containing protein [Polyangiaceae bacterium]
MHKSWMVATIAIGCAPAVPEPPSAQADSAGVWVEPPAPLEAVAPVMQLTIPQRSSETLVMIRGELSAYHQSRIRRGELSKTVEARRVDCVQWDGPNGAVLAPQAILDDAEPYTLAAMGEGVLAVLRVQRNDVPLLRRMWPPVGVASATAVAVYCAEAPIPSLTPGREEQWFLLQPGDVPARLTQGVGSRDLMADRCVTVRAEVDDSMPRVPPPLLSGLALEPLPLSRAAVDVPPPLPCAGADLPAPLGCLRLDGDRLHYYPTLGPTAVAVRSASGSALFALADGDELRVPGLSPMRAEALELYAINRSGLEAEADVVVQTSAARAHPVISEVLANAVGPEPEQEWVELFNDGTVPWQTEGYVLVDSAAQTPLPAAEIPPGGFALVVSEGFDPSSPFDVAPAAGAKLLRVEALGKQGIANSGEPLSLLAADGRAVSWFPALAQSKAGVSAARALDASVVSASSFGLSAEPGASPGAVNVLREP